MVKVSVSYLGETKPIDTIKKINKTNADYLHLDIVDGKFAETKNNSITAINKEVSNSQKPLDVHLMVEKPKKLIENFGLLNTEYITIHGEIKDPEKYIKQIKSYGLKAGIAIKLETPITKIENLLDKVDLVLLMAVKVGYSGQTFNEQVIEKINYLNKNKTYKIAVDGGINYEVANKLKELGVDILVSGSYITKAEEYQLQLDKLKD